MSTEDPIAHAYRHAQSNVALLADILNRRPAANAGLADAYALWSAEVYDLMGAMSAAPANDARVEALSAAQAWVPASVDCDAIALARYKVVPAHESMFHRFAVVAGDGKQQLYLGREVECQNMARKFAGAFLDGAFYQALAAAPQPTPSPAPAQPGQEGEPVLWVPPEQFANFVDAQEAPYGTYLPARKTSAGKFTTPLFAARAQADSVQTEIGEFVTLIAECRDAFPAPQPGDPLEAHWMTAMCDPGEVPGYLREVAARHALSTDSVLEDAARKQAHLESKP